MRILQLFFQLPGTVQWFKNQNETSPHTLAACIWPLYSTFSGVISNLSPVPAISNFLGDGVLNACAHNENEFPICHCARDR